MFFSVLRLRGHDGLRRLLRRPLDGWLRHGRAFPADEDWQFRKQEAEHGENGENRRHVEEAVFGGKLIPDVVQNDAFMASRDGGEFEQGGAVVCRKWREFRRYGNHGGGDGDRRFKPCPTDRSHADGIALQWNMCDELVRPIPLETDGRCGVFSMSVLDDGVEDGNVLERIARTVRREIDRDGKQAVRKSL